MSIGVDNLEKVCAILEDDLKIVLTTNYCYYNYNARSSLFSICRCILPLPRKITSGNVLDSVIPIEVVTQFKKLFILKLR